MLNFIHYIHISYEEFFTLRKYLLLFCILHFDLAYKSVFGLDSTQALMLGTFPTLSTRLASLGNLARTALSTDSRRTCRHGGRPKSGCCPQSTGLLWQSTSSPAVPERSEESHQQSSSDLPRPWQNRA